MKVARQLAAWSINAGYSDSLSFTRHSAAHTIGFELPAMWAADLALALRNPLPAGSNPAFVGPLQATTAANGRVRLFCYTGNHLTKESVRFDLTIVKREALELADKIEAEINAMKTAA